MKLIQDFEGVISDDKHSNIKLPVLCEITELTIAYVNKHPLELITSKFKMMTYISNISNKMSLR